MENDVRLWESNERVHVEGVGTTLAECALHGRLVREAAAVIRALEPGRVGREVD